MKRILKIAFVFSLVFAVVSCSDGEDGLNGAAGANGVNGTDGSDGTNGENGVGYDRLTKYGTFISKLEGTTNTGVSFVDEVAYKYAPELSNSSGANAVSYSGDDAYFNLSRYIANPDEHYQGDYIVFTLNVDDLGLNSQTFSRFYLNIDQHPIYLDDNTVFEADGSIYSDDLSVSNFVISNFSFDKNTNQLVLDYSFDLAADSAMNETANSMKVSGSIDVIVLEEI